MENYELVITKDWFSIKSLARLPHLVFQGAFVTGREYRVMSGSTGRTVKAVAGGGRGNFDLAHGPRKGEPKGRAGKNLQVQGSEVFDAIPINREDARIVIIGAGLAGLFTALKLAPLPVAVVTASEVGQGASSAWAQGGVSAALDEGDTAQAHAEDTIRAGAGIVDPEIARLLAEEAESRIEDLIKFGVPFDRADDGKLSLSREAAHSARRVARVTGDSAGQAIMAALIEAARNTPSIHFIENYKLRELVPGRNRIGGVVIEPASARSSAEPRFLAARAVVLAAGGIGGLYEVTTNPAVANGEILAIAARAGAVISDPEFVQFHPTAINTGRDPAPLATEALRGEGATLVNTRGDRFMLAVHPDAELAPRDIVARAVHRELVCGRGAYLDCREAIGQTFSERFPTVYEKCRAAGIDPVRELIPVAPAAHYHMGGIHTDANGRTTLDRLWACGEVAATGAHGANRLASNSLLEAVVFAARVAKDISGLPYCRHQGEYDRMRRRMSKALERRPVEMTPDVRHAVEHIRSLMTEHVGVIRSAEGLVYALGQFDEIGRKHHHVPMIRNMAMAAKLVSVAALKRTESRGGHFRADYPEPATEWQHRTFLTKGDVSEKRIARLLTQGQGRSHLEILAGE